MKKISATLTVVLLIIVLAVQPTVAQNVKATITVKLERLPHEKRIELQNFGDIIKNYIESTGWSDTKLPFDVEVNVQIMMERFVITYEDTYHARFFINSSTGYQESDKFWQFPYRKNQPLMHNVHIFDGLTGLIDFYMFIILGEEFDKFSTFGGESFFRKALTVAQYGKSDIYNKYWNYREDIVNKYLRESHKPFRMLNAATYAAVFYYLENNKEQTKIFANEILKYLKQVSKDYDENLFLIDYFKREHRKIAPVILNFTEEYGYLMEIDPAHKDFYRTLTKK